MAFSFGFFNSKNLDRTYTAENFTEYLSSLICDGIQDNYGRKFAFSAKGFNLIIGSGKAWINGHYFVSDSTHTIDLSEYADESLPRYVSVGICCNTNDNFRNIGFDILAGTPATFPAIPRFENTDDLTYLTLCAVRIDGDEMTVTDYRDNPSYCGYVQCILGKCRVTEMIILMNDMEKANEEMKEEIEKMHNIIDDNGKSAFEIAVEHGFIGTEIEWLESLHGKDGRDGIDGQTGADGKDGKDGITPDMSNYPNKADFENLQRKLQSLQDNTMDYILGLTNRCDSFEADIQQIRDSVQFGFQEKEEEILNLETRIIALESRTGINFITVFSSGNDALQKYGESIYTYYNDGYRSLAVFSESYPHFCCSDNNYALYFNHNDFSWAGNVFVLFLTPVALTSSMHLILRYISGENKDAEFYLVRKTDKTGSELARYIYEEVQAGNAETLQFKWLYSDTYISMMQSLENVSAGEYYLAFKGTSDNSHPMVESIKFMG